MYLAVAYNGMLIMLGLPEYHLSLVAAYIITWIQGFGDLTYLYLIVLHLLCAIALMNDTNESIPFRRRKMI
jgi:hypothetical protein